MTFPSPRAAILFAERSPLECRGIDYERVPTGTQEAGVQLLERYTRVKAILAQLSETDATIVRASAHGFCDTRIAEKLGVHRTTVSRRGRKAWAVVRDRLKAQGLIA